MLQIVFSALLFSLVTTCQGLSSPYYWRDFNGNVPSDAVAGGVDSGGVYYIVKALLPDYGIYIGQVYNGQTSVYVSYSTLGAYVASSTTLEILCSNSTKKPIWHASTLTITPLLISGSLFEPVIGGTTSLYDLNKVYIGKFVSNTGVTYVGSVHTDYFLYYAATTGTPAYSQAYELLVIDNSSNSNTTFNDEPLAGENKIAMHEKGLVS